MILKILQDGDKKLLKKSKKIAKIDDSVRELSNNLIETMKFAGGVGLASPQCGILKRLIVVSVNNEPKVFVNPEIIFESQEKIVSQEGCLSFNGQFYDISRSKTVTVKYRSLSGHPMIETYSDLVARCLLHEIDHLNGIVFKERVSD